MVLYLSLSGIISLIFAAVWIIGLAWAGLVVFYSKTTKRKKK